MSAVERVARAILGPSAGEIVAMLRAKFLDSAHAYEQIKGRQYTAQEAFWKGAFGDTYTERNVGGVAENRALFGRILSVTDGVVSALELGCGDGKNLRALRELAPSLELTGVEINDKAAAIAAEVASVVVDSLLDYLPARLWDFVYTKGVLIHIAPEHLPKAYETLYRCARRYIMVAEYYSPRPEMVPYRGHWHRLWKRDFAGDLMALYPNLKLVDYGFVYHGDALPQDDITWFLMEKR